MKPILDAHFGESYRKVYQKHMNGVKYLHDLVC